MANDLTFAGRVLKKLSEALSSLASTVGSLSSSKQDKLTPGANISILNNTISATNTNTTYTGANGITMSGTQFVLNMAYIYNLVYPVGCIYESYSATSPATLFGGTWVSYGPGRVMVATGTSDTSYGTVGAIGGSSTMPFNTTNSEASGYGLTGASAFMNRVLHNTSTAGSFTKDNRMPYITVYRWRRTA